MDAVQRLRTKAKEAGNLKSSKEQTVKTEPAPAGRTGAADHHHRIEQSRGGLRTDLQPDGRVRCLAVPCVSALLLLSAGLRPRARRSSPSAWAWSSVERSGATATGAAATSTSTSTATTTSIATKSTTTAIPTSATAATTTASGSTMPSTARAWAIATTATQQKYGRSASQQGMQSREQFRGHADQGREQISREGAGNQRDLSGNQVGTRDGRRIVSIAIWARRGRPRSRGGSQSRDSAIAESRLRRIAKPRLAAVRRHAPSRPMLSAAPATARARGRSSSRGGAVAWRSAAAAAALKRRARILRDARIRSPVDRSRGSTSGVQPVGAAEGFRVGRRSGAGTGRRGASQTRRAHCWRCSAPRRNRWSIPEIRCRTRIPASDSCRSTQRRMRSTAASRA